MEITNYGLDDVHFDLIKYVVLIAEFRGEFLIIRNKNKTEWELPGGKREEGEEILKAAGRELFEETGALDFELIPYGIYLLNGSYGMNFFARIFELGSLPDFEIAEVNSCEALPQGLAYGNIYYEMLRDWNELKDKNMLKKYRVRNADNGITHKF